MFLGSIALEMSRDAIGVASEFLGGVDGGVVSGEGGVGAWGAVDAGCGVISGASWMLSEFSLALISEFSPSFRTLCIPPLRFASMNFTLRSTRMGRLSG